MVQQVAIVGGGISGLSAAYFLSRAGVSCTLIEPAERLGGVIRTERVEGCVMEAGPDSFIAQKPWALELIRELGMEQHVIGSNDHLRQTYICRNGQLVPLPDGIQFMAPTKLLPVLTSRLFGWKSKSRMALEWFRRPDAQQGDRSVAEFVTDHYGKEVTEYLAQPMLAGVYGGAVEKLSVNSVLPMFVDLEKRYGSLTRGMLRSRKKRATSTRTAGSGPLFLSLQEGMSQLTEALAGRLEKEVRRVRASVRSVQNTQGRITLHTESGPIAADVVVLATPAYRAGEILQSLDPELAGLLAKIPYTSSLTAALVYRRPEFQHPLDGFGFLVPARERRNLTACSWVNTKFSHRAAPDRAVLRAFLAAEQAEEAFGLSDDEVASRVHQELSALMGFNAQPAAWRIHRWKRAMAQYEVGHARLLEQIESRLARRPAIHLTGNAYGGIGIPDCIRRSRQVAEQLIAAERGKP